jgi:hypothetical protein
LGEEYPIVHRTDRRLGPPPDRLVHARRYGASVLASGAALVLALVLAPATGGRAGHLSSAPSP